MSVEKTQQPESGVDIKGMPKWFAELLGRTEKTTQEAKATVEEGIPRTEDFCSTLDTTGNIENLCLKLEECFSYNPEAKKEILEFNKATI